MRLIDGALMEYRLYGSPNMERLRPVESRQCCRDIVDCTQNPSLDHLSREKVILVVLVDAWELAGYLGPKISVKADVRYPRGRKKHDWFGFAYVALAAK
jgi:hypothetical protein